MPQFQSLCNVVISSYNRPPAAIRLEKDQIGLVTNKYAGGL